MSGRCGDRAARPVRGGLAVACKTHTGHTNALKLRNDAADEPGCCGTSWCRSEGRTVLGGSRQPETMMVIMGRRNPNGMSRTTVYCARVANRPGWGYFFHDMQPPRCAKGAASIWHEAKIRLTGLPPEADPTPGHKHVQ